MPAVLTFHSVPAFVPMARSNQKMKSSAVRSRPVFGKVAPSRILSTIELRSSDQVQDSTAAPSMVPVSAML